MPQAQIYKCTNTPTHIYCTYTKYIEAVLNMYYACRHSGDTCRVEWCCIYRGHIATCSCNGSHIAHTVPLVHSEQHTHAHTHTHTLRTHMHVHTRIQQMHTHTHTHMYTYAYTHMQMYVSIAEEYIPAHGTINQAHT